jgi:hypothetical protein
VLNFVAVLAGTGLCAWLLFLRHPGAAKILSASRWMLLAWGFLILVHYFSPITYLNLGLSWFTWLYCALWLGSFILGESVDFTIGAKPQAVRAPKLSMHCSARGMQVLTLFAFLGAIILAYVRTQTVTASDFNSLIIELRATQVAQADSGLFKTVGTVLACGGLLVVLVEVCSAVRNQTRITLRAGFALLAYLSVTVVTGGRPGAVLGTLSLFVAATAAVYLSGVGFAKFRLVLLVGAFVVVTSLGYIMFVVSARTSEYTGGMDNKISGMNLLWAADLKPEFREGLRPFGVLGDTVIESFYYMSIQLYGLDYTLEHYRGPFGFGFTEFPYVARRVESLFGVAILDPSLDANDRMFEERGIWPHIFLTGVYSTFFDFGLVLSIPFVFVCGRLARRTRMRALQSGTPFSISLQALVCSGAAWTIIGSPFGEQSWAFPCLWFLLLPALAKAGDVLCLLSSPAAVSARQRRRV